MKYFTIEELTRSTTARLRGIDNTPSQQVIDNLNALVDNVLDPLREAWGKPLHVNSGYRCRALNKAVGGVPASQHMRGEAADITAGSEAGNLILAGILIEQGKFDQMILEKGGRLGDTNWIHVSYVANGRNRKEVLFR